MAVRPWKILMSAAGGFIWPRLMNVTDIVVVNKITFIIRDHVDLIDAVIVEETFVISRRICHRLAPRADLAGCHAILDIDTVWLIDTVLKLALLESISSATGIWLVNTYGNVSEASHITNREM
jgi:hypothetical protein